MSKEILDDIDWENEEPEDENDGQSQPYDENEVVMLKTFNTEEEAYICAASLKNEGIDAHVITSATGQMTPFAYGMVRLYVAESQVDEATAVLKRSQIEEQVYENPKLTSGRILVIIFAGLFILATIIGVIRLFFVKFI
jgi:hypothetical protein